MIHELPAEIVSLQEQIGDQYKVINEYPPIYKDIGCWWLDIKDGDKWYVICWYEQNGFGLFHDNEIWYGCDNPDEYTRDISRVIEHVKANMGKMYYGHRGINSPESDKAKPHL